MATELDKLLIKISADVSELTKATQKSVTEIQKIAKATERTSEEVNKSASKMSKAFEMLKFEKVVEGIGKVANAIQKLGSFILDIGAYATETENLFKVAFGDELVGRAEGFVQRLNQAFGVNETVLKNVMGRYYMLAESMGLTSNQAYTVAQDMTFLGKELSSLYNVSESIAWKKLSSGLAGQVQPLNEWGISVRIASLEETALRYGIEGKISAMTEAQKVQLRYLTILDATKKAQGDSARTIDDLANSWRRVKNEMYTVAESIASALVPVFEALLPPIMVVIDAIKVLAQTFINFVNMFTGGSKKQAESNAQVAKSAKEVQASGSGGVPSSAIKSVQQLGDAQKKTAKETEKATKISENQLFKFDELNQLKRETDTSGAGGGAGAGAGAGAGGGGGAGGAGVAPDFDLIGEPKLDVSGITDGFDKIAESADRLTQILMNLFQPFKDAWDKYGQRVIDSFKEAFQALEPIIVAIKDALVKVWENGGKRLVTGLAELGLVLLELGGKLLKPVLDGLGTLAKLFMPVLSGAISIVLNFIAWLVEKLVDLIDWLNQNEYAMQILQGAIELVVVALGILAGIVVIVIGAVALLVGGFLAWSGVASLVGGAIALITSPLAPLVVAIGTAIVAGILLVKNWDAIKEEGLRLWGIVVETWNKAVERVKEAGRGMMDFFTHVKESFMEWAKKVNDIFWKTLTDINNLILRFIADALKWFVDFVRNTIAKFTELKDAVVKKWNELVTSLKNKLEEWKTAFANGWNYIRDRFITPATNAFVTFKNKVVEVWGNIKKAFTGVLDYVKTTFSNAWSTAWSKVKSTFSKAWEGLANVVKAPLNGVISMLNRAIGALNKFKVNIPDWVPIVGGKSFGFNMPKIPMLADGGVITRATLAMVGEGGDEAVLPLENTGVMDRLGAIIANSVVSAMSMNKTTSTEQPTTVVMQLDNIQFGKAIISAINREKRRTGVKINGIY